MVSDHVDLLDTRACQLAHGPGTLLDIILSRPWSQTEDATVARFVQGSGIDE